MTLKEIQAAANAIYASLSDSDRQYAREESIRRTNAGESANTPFSCLHDRLDANELLPEESIVWNFAVDGPDCTDANRIIELVNRLILT